MTTALVLWGCGAKDEEGARPDAPSADAAGDSVLTIRLFTSEAFVDGETANASFVAVQDGGEGAWTEVVGDRGVYRVALRSSRYGSRSAARWAPPPPPRSASCSAR